MVVVQGVVTALSALAITVAPSTGKPVTCAIQSAQATVAAPGLKAGANVQMACEAGVLVKVTIVPPPSTDKVVTGVVTALGPRSITADGLTCAITSSSYKQAGIGVGDRVSMQCNAAKQLLKVTLAPEAKAPPPKKSP